MLYVQRFGHHRDLLSFPTRRSSDLTSRWRSRSRWGGVIGSMASAAWPERRRSEEHTSELQSRGHLVCRLLLEKKKPSPSAPTTWCETTTPHGWNSAKDREGRMTCCA